MPIGKLAVFDEGFTDGSLEYSSAVKMQKLENLSKELEHIFYAEYKPSKAYIVIVTETKNQFAKWRLWLNNFSITKEFKPNEDILMNGNFLNLHVFDVSPFVQKGKNQLVVSRMSNEPIYVHLISTATLYEVSGFRTEYTLGAGVLALKPYESIKLSGKENNYIVVRIPLKSKLIVEGSKNTLEMEGNSDGEEIEIPGEVFIRHEGKVKDPALIYLHYTSRESTPKIDIEANSRVENLLLNISIVNKSEIGLDRVLVNVMLNGITIYFKSIENVKDGDSLNLSFPLNQRKGNLHLRVVGIKAGVRKILDKDVEW
ncbi:hypothetical protein [Acidianus sp. RZ1]|uniref:hypothetical protein n=1 Tax=Acidianus sp. RZ1 TaxID=1540082 RepID=UPI00149154C7|nr:hypothetical protein [Acidianus sp. RZ1]NON62590.1 hypothetical protein [Acidianus sp. RZ1]